MEENTQQPTQIEVIDKDAILQIKFRPDFYQRLVLVFKSIIEGKTAEELEDAFKQVQEKTAQEEWMYNYETMFHLIKATEEYAKANNLTKMVDPAEFLNEENPN
jgi:hypothetical protein